MFFIRCTFKPIHELESQYFLNESNDYLMNRDVSFIELIQLTE